jgi:uncharacterized protein YbaR (Trm112 family)
MTNDKTGKHSRGLICDKCKGNLKAMMYYTSSGELVRGGDLFYCDSCETTYKITKQEVATK